MHTGHCALHTASTLHTLKNTLHTLHCSKIHTVLPENCTLYTALQTHCISADITYKAGIFPLNTLQWKIYKICFFLVQNMTRLPENAVYIVSPWHSIWPHLFDKWLCARSSSTSDFFGPLSSRFFSSEKDLQRYGSSWFLLNVNSSVQLRIGVKYHGAENVHFCICVCSNMCFFLHLIRGLG